MIFSKEEAVLEREKVIDAIINSAVFIYPTDTIYGIGCNALNSKAVQRIRDLKKRPIQPFSVIAPNKEWIKENCELYSHFEQLDKLPGQFTFILLLKNKKAVSKYVNPESDTLGVRIPSHWFTDFVKLANVPIVTTSVNKSGESYMTSLDDIDKDIKNSVDFIFYEGEKSGKPSTIIIFEKDNFVIKERK